MPSMTRAGYTPPRPEPQKIPAKPHKKGGKKRKKGKRGMGAAGVVSLLIFALAALIGAATLYIYSATQPYAHAYIPGTMLSGYPLAGATREDSEALLAKIVGETIEPWKFTIECMGQRYSVTAEDVRLTVNAEKTLGPLWAAGHTGSMLDRFIEMEKRKREPLIAAPVLEYDLTAVDGMLENILLDAEYPPVDATLSYHPGSAEPFRFTQEETGRSVDLGGMRERIERALLSLEAETVVLEPRTIEPQVYQAQLEEALSLRARVVSAVTGDEAAQANVRLAAAGLAGVRLEAG
ncbi:MAG: peptidoglycan binding domain-containing protein, partial [Clostridia bacterium]|nr:peptidoglycan binding domain-containing protein [Clostridia bacterium]